mgnify:CR=1 FL=1
MSDYEAIRTEAPPALEDFPSIEDTGAVIRQVNRLFDPYVFFERHKDSIELWCSCCLRHGEIDILPRIVTTVEYELLYNKHNMHVTCPYCGARATYKNARKLGKKTRLPQYLPVVLLAEKTATFTREHTGRAKPMPHSTAHRSFTLSRAITSRRAGPRYTRKATAGSSRTASAAATIRCTG